MTEIQSLKSKGAPLRALLAIVAVWVVGRIIWEVLSLRSGPTATVIAKLDRPNQQEIPTGISDKPRPPDFQASDDPINRSMLGRAFVEQGAIVNSVRPLPRYQVKGSLASRSDSDLTTDFSKNFSNLSPFVIRPRTSEIVKRDLSGVKRKPEIALPNTGKSLSGFFWIFARQNDTASFLSPPQSPSNQYGASQAGAILRYRLLGDSQRKLSIFTRVSTALSSSGEEELAVGTMAKPLPKIPVSIFAEQRIGTSDKNRGIALYAAGGTGPNRILGNLELETYGQAGFLFADKDTHFFDGSVVAQTKLVQKDRKSIVLGAGLWAAGQKGATRFDIGPRVDIRFPIGDLAARASVDWRQRVAGDANPGSGVSVSLSTGF